MRAVMRAVMTCEEAQTALVLGGSPEATAHTQACARCAAAAGRATALRRCLSAYQPGEPLPGHRERTMAAAAALLAARAASLRGPRRRLAWALTVVFALLPLVVAANAQLLRMAHAFLGGFLPSFLTSYLVGSLTSFLAILLALGCAAVPLLAARQRIRWPEEIHV